MKLEKIRKKNTAVLCVLAALVLVMSLVCTVVGSSRMGLAECLRAMAGQGSAANVRIVRAIRIPRVLAAIIAGAGLSVSGLIMQTTLNNSMASPSTLGVADAAVFGANLSIIAFSGGFFSAGGNAANLLTGIDPYAAGLMAFVFSALSVLLILALCRVRAFSPGVVVLAGIAVGSVWKAATTVLQFYATDTGLSAAVIWSFGDLGRATYKTDLIMLAAVLFGTVFFLAVSWRYNALLSGEPAAKSMGVNVAGLRFASLLISSLITAVCVSFLGVIGFVGIICPHVMKRILGQDHRVSVPASALCGSLLLLTADTLSRCIGGGAALPVGAVTSLLGAPFFLGLLLFKKEH